MDDPPSVENDADLAIRLMLGESSAFDVLIRDHGPKVKGYLGAKFPDHVADEAWAEAIVKVWKNADSYDESKGTIGAWFLAIAHNAALDILRCKKRKDREELADDFPYRAPSPTKAQEGDDDDITKQEQQRREPYQKAVRDIIGGLNSEQQRVVLQADLAYLSGEVPHEAVAPAEDLADALKTNKNNIYKIRHDARANLRKEMVRRGFYKSEEGHTP